MAPPKPEMPRDEEPQLPRGVEREIRKHARRDPDDVALALSLGSDAIDQEIPEAGLPYLEWAKHVCPRSTAIRETLGVAYYLTEDYASALTELQAYRRLSGRQDQNHVIADCHRALGRDARRIAELVEAMADDAPSDRYVEGLIVWAATLADAGDVAAGQAVLRPRLAVVGEPSSPEDADVRLWYAAGDLAERAGDRQRAIEWFERVLSADADSYDAGARIASLRDQ